METIITSERHSDLLFSDIVWAAGMWLFRNSFLCDLAFVCKVLFLLSFWSWKHIFIGGRPAHIPFQWLMENSKLDWTSMSTEIPHFNMLHQNTKTFLFELNKQDTRYLGPNKLHNRSQWFPPVWVLITCVIELGAGASVPRACGYLGTVTEWDVVTY